jgi:hypothetical protein
VLVVAAVLGLLIGARLVAYDGNPTGFIQFGRRATQYTHPPTGAIVRSPFGYDGEFYWIQASDPLLLRDATVVNLFHTDSGYHLQRPAYPALAYLVAGGQRSALPWTMLAVNVLVLLAITAGFASYARCRGWSVWWALAVGLMPGLVLATLRDLSDPLAIASMLAGLLLWQRGRSWGAAGMLSVAVLAREPMTLAVVAIAIDAVAAWWRSRREPQAIRRAVSRAWPAVAVPAAAFMAWQAYIHGLHASGVAAAVQPIQPIQPLFSDFVAEARRTIAQDSPFGAAWDLGYLTLTLAGMGAAIALVRREITAASVAALLFALNLIVITFGDQWGLARYAAPVFAALLLGGLEQRSRFPASRVAVSISVVAAAMIVSVPLAIPGA